MLNKVRFGLFGSRAKWEALEFFLDYTLLINKTLVFQDYYKILLLCVGMKPFLFIVVRLEVIEASVITNSRERES